MAKDLFHKAVKTALQREGWTITHDPYKIDTKQPKFDYEIDLGQSVLLVPRKERRRLQLK